MSIGDFAPPAGLAPLLSAVGNEAFALRVPVAYGGLLVTKLQVTSSAYTHRMSHYLIEFP